MSTERRLLVSLGVSVLIVLVVSGISFRNTLILQGTNESIVHSYQVLRAVASIRALLADAESGQRGFLIIPDSVLFVPYDHPVKKLDSVERDLLRLTLDNPSQQAAIKRIVPLVKYRLALLNQGIQKAKIGGIDSVQSWIRNGPGNRVMDSVRALTDTMLVKENQLLIGRNEEAESKSTTGYVISTILFFALMAVCAPLYFRFGGEIEARRKAFKALEIVSADAEALSKELETFSYSISHDLRAPLRAINGFSNALMEDYGATLPEDGRRYLRRINDGARRMGQLIDDLLAFSRIGRKDMSPGTAIMTQLARSVADELLEGEIGTVEFRIGQMPNVLGDVAMLRQVWINLLSNAVKYSRPKADRRIEVGFTPSIPGSGANGVFYVKDNGVGFDMNYSSKLFEVFQRLHGRDEFEGTGVGLALVRRIIQRHEGTIWADAKKGDGATFYFTIPTILAVPLTDEPAQIIKSIP